MWLMPCSSMSGKTTPMVVGLHAMLACHLSKMSWHACVGGLDSLTLTYYPKVSSSCSFHILHSPPLTTIPTVVIVVTYHPPATCKPFIRSPILLLYFLLSSSHIGAH
ncbi:hypothetical protein L2E82_40788 [Cichorium intybus]|uniref:Uncharacterized protein n=1 Tax=Cichorium intybus TaxID=13427 RepID=A0ACB9ALF4_CICIN|nr:hypothetical protein L2E82_40788 [Cichorium intybus]